MTESYQQQCRLVGEGRAYIFLPIFYLENLCNAQSLYFHIHTSAVKHKYSTLIVRFFLFQLARIQYRDRFIFKHFAFTSKVL